MELDISEFRARLEKELAKGSTNITEFIHKEIRLSEIMKASLMEEMSVETSDFLTGAAAKFDTYIFQLQEIEKELGLRNLPLDQETALKDTSMRKKFSKEMNELKKMDPEKYKDESAEGMENS